MKIILYLSTIIFFSCNNIDSKIDKRIHLYETYKTEYLDSIYIRPMRESYRPKVQEFEVRKVKGEFLGYMQTLPNKLWHHNGDTMDLDFIEIFSKFDCSKLYNFDNFAFIEFLDNKKRVIIFKGNPNYKGIPHIQNNYFIDTIEPISYKNGWKYIIADFKGEN